METTSSPAAGRVRMSLVALGVLGAVIVPASGAAAATSVGRFITLPAGAAAGLEIDGVAL
jgi:hypothetical protein